VAGGGPDEIPVGSPVLAAGEGRGNAWGVPRGWFAPDLGAGAVPAHGLDGGGQRCAPSSGEAGAWPRQGAAGLAPAEARGAPGAVAQLQKRVAVRLGSGAHGAAAVGLSRLWCLDGAREKR
jgi:hypothetical protein